MVQETHPKEIPVRVGVHLMRFDSVEPSALRQELADTARAAEDAGVAWMSVMDHYFQMVRAGFPAEDPMLEAYTTLGYLAGVTSNVQLGVLVTGVTYRYPGLLAKIVATLDVLSGGRATLGLRAAWYEEEHQALGGPDPPPPGGVGRPWAWVRPGTRRSTRHWACRTRPSRSGSSASRRRCRSAARCGTRRTTGRTRARTTGWRRRCARLSRSGAPRSSSAGRGSAR